jgi:hypothetical protein
LEAYNILPLVMASLTDETTIFTIPNGAAVEPLVDAINLREGTFQILTVGTLGITTLTTDNINEATIGNGTTVNGLNIGSGTFGGRPYNELSATTANAGIAIVPNGNGAITVTVADGAAAGGNNRGTFAIDLQRTRGGATSVASGTYSLIVQGSGNTASSQFSNVINGANNVSGGNGYNFIGNGLNHTISGLGPTTCSIINGVGNSLSDTIGGMLFSTIIGGSACTISNASNAIILTGTNHVINWTAANGDGGLIAGGNLCTITDAQGYIFGANTANVINASRALVICSDGQTVDNSSGIIWASGANVSLSTEVSVGADTAVVTNCLNSSALFGTGVTLTNADSSLAGGDNVSTTFANTVVLGDGVTPTAASAANEMTLNYSAGLRLLGNVVRLSDLSEIYSMQTVVTTVGVTTAVLISIPTSPAVRYCTAVFSIIGRTAAGDVASITDQGVIETSTGTIVAASLNPIIFTTPALAAIAYALVDDGAFVSLKATGVAAQTINWSATITVTGSN